MNEPKTSTDAAEERPSDLPLHRNYREYSRRNLRKYNILFYILAAVLLIAVATGSFVAGFGLGRVGSTTSARGTGQFGGRYGNGGGFGQRTRGGVGTVTSISSSSITITEDTFRGTSDISKTYSISSGTTVTNDGSSASVSDIKTGDTVRIETDTSTSTAATAIEINPSFGGSGGQTQDDSGSSDSGDSTGSTT